MQFEGLKVGSSELTELAGALSRATEPEQVESSALAFPWKYLRMNVGERGAEKVTAWFWMTGHASDCFRSGAGAR